MKEKFGVLPTGEEATLYTISCGRLTAKLTDCGAALVSLLVPDRDGNVADVVLGCDDVSGYFPGGAFLGATVGRNANRVHNACFILGNKTVALSDNENGNNLHSGPDSTNKRLWTVTAHSADRITFRLLSPHGHQGFPGNAVTVSYTHLTPPTMAVV